MNEALRKGGSNGRTPPASWRGVSAAYRRLSEQGDRREHDQPSDRDHHGAERFSVRVAGNDEIYPSQQTAVVLYSENFARQKPQIATSSCARMCGRCATTTTRSRMAHRRPQGGGGDHDADRAHLHQGRAIHRSITPAAIDPDGRMNLDGLRNDLASSRSRSCCRSEHHGRAHHRHVVR